MKTFLKLSLILLIFNSCSDDCSDMMAETGPVSFQFEVVKNDTHENIFSLGLYTQNDIHIEDQNGVAASFDFLGENNLNLINVLLGWETKNDVYTVTIGENIEFQIVYSLKRTETECNSTTKLTNLEIQGMEYENLESGPIQILVP